MISAIFVQIVIALVLFSDDPLLHFYMILLIGSSIAVQVLHMAFSGVVSPCYEFVSAAGVFMLVSAGIDPVYAILIGKILAFFMSPMVLLIAWVFGR
ncbi:MAG: hypothetical protein ABH829_02345 [archaeon]